MSPRILRIALCSAVVCAAIAHVASAQAGSAVQALDGPRTLRSVSHRSAEHGCSRSFGVSSAELTLELSIDPSGAAQLSIQGHSRSMIASRGAGGTSVTGHAIAGVARGTASLGADAALTVRFVDLDLASVYWTGPGTLPVGPSSVRPFPHTLTCRVEHASLLPAGPPTAGEVALSTTLAHCTWAGGLPSELTGYADPDTWLGSGSGIELHRDEGLTSSAPEVTLRAR